MTAPVFKVFTDAMIPYTASVDGVIRKFIRTTASSTVTDRKGHEFDIKALQKMGETAKGMTIFLNHEYRVPEDLFGTVVEADAQHKGADDDGNAIWDLNYNVMVNEANPRAVQAWDSYQQGVRMGVSVGVMVKQWEKHPNDPDIKRITDVENLEASIVGIPANPRTWVGGAIKSINAYSAAEEDGLFETLDMIGSVEQKADPEKPDNAVPTPDDGESKKQPEGESSEPIDPENDDSLAGQELAKSDTDEANSDATEDLAETRDPEVSASGATQSAPESESETRPEASIAAGIDAVVSAYKMQVQDRDDQIAALTKERDEAREASRTAMEIVERVASLPLGRKASFQYEVKSFRQSLAGVYGEDFLAFLDERKAP